jgi:hypothetical protein
MIGARRRFRFSCVKASWAAIVRGAGHVALAAIRATTHVDGKAIRSSRRCSTGRRLLVEDDRGPISSSPIAWRPASADRRPLTGRARPRMGVPVGEGSARPRSGRSRDGRPRARLARASPAVAVVRTRPDGALARQSSFSQLCAEPMRMRARPPVRQGRALAGTRGLGSPAKAMRRGLLRVRGSVEASGSSLALGVIRSVGQRLVAAKVVDASRWVWREP